MRALVILVSLVVFICPAGSKTVDAEKINGAQWDRSFNPKKGESPLLIKAQILFARAYFSPGEIGFRPFAAPTVRELPQRRVAAGTAW